MDEVNRLIEKFGSPELAMKHLMLCERHLYALRDNVNRKAWRIIWGDILNSQVIQEKLKALINIRIIAGTGKCDTNDSRNFHVGYETFSFNPAPSEEERSAMSELVRLSEILKGIKDKKMMHKVVFRLFDLWENPFKDKPDDYIEETKELLKVKICQLTAQHMSLPNSTAKKRNLKDIELLANIMKVL